MFAEDVIYKPVGGGTREIKAIIDYEQLDDMAGGMTPRILIDVRNDATYGISTNEVDPGVDKVSLPTEYGGTDKDRLINGIVSQDKGRVIYLVN